MSASESSESATWISIGGITFALAAGDPSLKIGLEGGMDRFRVRGMRPDLSVTAAWGDLSGSPEGEVLFDSGGAWRLYGRTDGYCFQCKASQFGDTPYTEARLNRDFSSAKILLHRPFFKSERTVYPLQYPLDEVLVLNLLSRDRGVEMHACGIVDSSGKGLLFAGESGAGKTTMAGLWTKEPGVTVLSDDRIILRQDEGRLWMYGTPWHGDGNHASASRVPLKAVLFIRHGRRNRIKKLSGAEAAASLFSRSFPVFYSPEGLRFTLEFFDTLTRAVPCYELNVVPDQRVIEFVRIHL